MKVSITKDSKKIVTLYDMPAVNALIESVKEDENTAKDYAAMAAGAVFDGYSYDVKVYEATAEIAKNSRIWNEYHDTSADFDVWINFTAQSSEGFVIGGAYLTDIWKLDGHNYKEICGRMYIRKFTESN